MQDCFDRAVLRELITYQIQWIHGSFLLFVIFLGITYFYAAFSGEAVGFGNVVYPAADKQ